MPVLLRWTSESVLLYTAAPLIRSTLGHLEIARGVSKLFEIDEFLFVPARVAPHKQDAQVSSAISRYAMLTLATQDDPRLCVSTFELERAHAVHG